MTDVFISYSSRDREAALSLSDYLKSAGFTVWIDRESLGGATRWSAEIAKALSESKALLFLLSGSSIQSENVVKEVSLAAEAKIPMVPIEIEKVVLPFNLKYHLVGIQRIKIDDRQGITSTLHRILKHDPSIARAFTPRISFADQDERTVRVAVLPFDDVSPAHDNQWFADGMMDELIGTLGSLQELRVASRTDVLCYRHPRPTLRQIAEDLNIRYLIEGSVRKAGEKMRINVSLVDAQRNESVWSDRYDGTFENVFEVQESVAKNITEALKLKLTPAEVKRVARRLTDDPEAYELYLKGLDAMRAMDREGYKNALHYFDQASKLDTQFAEAYINAAATCTAYYRECSRDPKWLSEAESYLAKAKSVHGETSLTLWEEAWVTLLRNNDHEAEELLLKAIRLEPNFGAAYSLLGNVYSSRSDSEKAVWAFREALRCDDRHSNYFNLLATLHGHGSTPEIISIAQAAIPVIKKYIQRFPHDNSAVWQLAYIYHWANDDIEASKIADQLHVNGSLDGVGLFNLANLYDDLGKPEIALDLLRKAVDSGFRQVEALENVTFQNIEDQEALNDITRQMKSLIEKEQADT